MWILIGIALFMFLVFIHELGHYLTAKRAWVKVLEFWIWIPPRAKNLYTDASGTHWTLNRIPLGGFVRLKGEDPQWEEFLDDDSFVTATLPWKLLILAWGVIMNILFARAIFAFSFWVWVQPITLLPEWVAWSSSTSYLMPTASFLEEQWFLSWDLQAIPVQVTDLLDWGLAQRAGIQVWDILERVGGEDVTTSTLWWVLSAQWWRTFDIVARRDEETFTTTISCPDDQCLLGIVMDAAGDIQVLPIQMPLSQAIWAWRSELMSQTRLTLRTLGTLGRNLVSWDRERVSWSVEQLSWPVGIVHMWDMILSEWGWVMYLAFGGMISLALAIFNILPIPALDGWRAVSVIIQSLLWISPHTYFKKEALVNTVVFVLLLLFGWYIIFQDIQRIVDINGSSQSTLTDQSDE